MKEYVTFLFEDILNILWTENDTFSKTKFPCTRWGNVYTRTATTNKKFIEDCIKKLKELNYDVRKRICHETTNRLNRGKFYKIEVCTQ
jgi:hypothetical protein